MKGINDAVGSSLKDVSSVVGKSVKASDVLPSELLSLPDQAKEAQGDASAALKSLSGIGKELDELEKTVSKLLQLIDKATKAVNGADFGLDPKKPEGKKAIAAAQKKILAALDKARDEIDGKRKTFADLNKTVASAGKSSTVA